MIEPNPSKRLSPSGVLNHQFLKGKTIARLNSLLNVVEMAIERKFIAIQIGKKNMQNVFPDAEERDKIMSLIDFDNFRKTKTYVPNTAAKNEDSKDMSETRTLANMQQKTLVSS
jgi:hypothetical protein